MIRKLLLLLLLPAAMMAQERSLLPVIPSPVAPVNGTLGFPARMFRLTMVPNVSDTSAEYYEYSSQGANIGIGFKVFPDAFYTKGWTNIGIGGKIMPNAHTGDGNTASDNIAIGWSTLNGLSTGS